MSDFFPALQRGYLLISHGRAQEALVEFGRMAAEYPDNTDVLAGLSRAHLELENFDEAESAARDAILSDPTDPAGHYVLASVLQQRNRVADAVEAINVAIEIEPYDEDNYSMLAGLEIQRRNWARAEEVARTGLEINPEDPSLIANLSFALQQQGKADQGLAEAQRIVQQNPEDSEAFWLNGQAKLHRGEYREALKDFQEALRLDPGCPIARDGLVTALKAQYWPYRVFLNWVFWMNKYSYKVQFAIIIAMFVGMRILRQLARANPILEYVYWPIAAAYIFFACFTWWSDPLFTLLVRCSKYGRNAFDREETRHSNWMAVVFGLMAVSALIAVSGAIWNGSWGFYGFTSGILLAVVSLPLSQVLSCDEGWPKTTAISLSIAFGAIAVIHIFAVLIFLALGETLVASAAFAIAIGLFLLGALGGFVLQFFLGFLVAASPTR